MNMIPKSPHAYLSMHNCDATIARTVISKQGREVARHLVLAVLIEQRHSDVGCYGERPEVLGNVRQEMTQLRSRLPHQRLNIALAALKKRSTCADQQLKAPLQLSRYARAFLSGTFRHQPVVLGHGH